jgi:monolysocardiolipin acyltransferase
MSTDPPSSPSLPWRATSSVVMGITGAISRTFLYGFNKTEAIGLDRFLELLDSRKDVESRKRGLITGALSSDPSLSVADEEYSI